MRERNPERAEQILEFIRSYIRDEGIAPSVREI